MSSSTAPQPSKRPRRDALRRGLDRTLEAALFVSLSAMTLAVLWQVASRFLLGDPSSITEELARYLMMWVGLLGATYAIGQGLHPSVGSVHLWLARVVPFARSARHAPRLLVAVFGALVLLVGGSELVRLTFELRQTSAALQLPLGWVYSVLPLSGVLLLLYCCCTPSDGGR